MRYKFCQSSCQAALHHLFTTFAATSSTRFSTVLGLDRRFSFLLPQQQVEAQLQESCSSSEVRGFALIVGVGDAIFILLILIN